MNRADKLLAGTGRWSRSEAKELIRQGRVWADGRPVAKPEEKLDGDTVSLTVDGEPVACRPFIYLMLHKPGGVITATEDPRRATVMDLLPRELKKRGVFPVGRLDKDTEGLLLLTDDGDLAHRLLSPRHHVDKVYYAKVDGLLSQSDVDAFREGMVLEDGLHCLPAGLEILEGGMSAHITLREGKYHQVKRMMAARGKPVSYLKRCSMGGLALPDDLPAGEWRLLTAQELATLRVENE